jgi:hypothetical protein
MTAAPWARSRWSWRLSDERRWSDADGRHVRIKQVQGNGPLAYDAYGLPSGEHVAIDVP